MVKTGNKWRYPEYSADKAQAHIREGQANMGARMALTVQMANRLRILILKCTTYTP